MPSQKTLIADVIQPELFGSYVIDRTVQLSRLVESGIMVQDAELSRMVGEGGISFTMPSWNDLDGEEQIMNDVDPIETGKITSKAEVATKYIRARGWAAHELAGALAGDSPFTAIGNLVSEWWVRREQVILFSILQGIFSSTATNMHGESMQDLVAGDIATPQAINAGFVLDAKQLLGDMSGQLTAIYMHSAVKTELQKQNLIVFIPNARGEVVIPTYLGYRVIEDDSAINYMVGADRFFETYLMASGVFHRGENVPVDLTPVSIDRDEPMSTDRLWHRRAFAIHPMGISWMGIGSTVDPTPSNAELATGTNWQLVRELKKIGIVKMIHTLA